MKSGGNANVAIGEGSDACPSCKSDAWKSARMVILEGTTFTSGTIKGDITNPGALSGRLQAFLLSDRWFSWDHKLEADIDVTSESGLVLAVKKLMTEYGSLVQFPPAPNEPPNVGSFEQNYPVGPTRPTEPEKLEPPVYRPWYSWFWLNLRPLVIFFGPVSAVYLYFSRGLIYNYKLAGGIGAALVWIALLGSFTGNRDAKRNFERDQAILVVKHQKACRKYEEDLAKFKLDYRRAAEQEQDHLKAVALYQQELAKYHQQLANFEDEKRRVLKARELIWERARVCSRCGNAYQGKA